MSAPEPSTIDHQYTGTTSLNIRGVTSSNAVVGCRDSPLLGAIAPGASAEIHITFSPIVDGLRD